MGASVCMYLFVCKVVFVQKRLCRKAPVLKSFCVQKCPHAKVSVCVGIKASVLKNMLCIKICPSKFLYVEFSVGEKILRM